MQYYLALHTNKGHLKKKSYQDGFVAVHKDGKAALLGADGNHLASGRLLPPIDPATEGLTWEGYLINLDGQCTAADVPGGPNNGSVASVITPSVVTNGDSASAALSMQPATRHKGKVPSLHRTTFKPPVRADAPASVQREPTIHAAASRQEQLRQQQAVQDHEAQQRWQQPAVVSKHQRGHIQHWPRAAAPSAPSIVRSDHEIMAQLFQPTAGTSSNHHSPTVGKFALYSSSASPRLRAPLAALPTNTATPGAPPYSAEQQDTQLPCSVRQHGAMPATLCPPLRQPWHHCAWPQEPQQPSMPATALQLSQFAMVGGESAAHPSSASYERHADEELQGNARSAWYLQHPTQLQQQSHQSHEQQAAPCGATQLCPQQQQAALMTSTTAPPSTAGYKSATLTACAARRPTSWTSSSVASGSATISPAPTAIASAGGLSPCEQTSWTSKLSWSRTTPSSASATASALAAVTRSVGYNGWTAPSSGDAAAVPATAKPSAALTRSLPGRGAFPKLAAPRPLGWTDSSAAACAVAQSEVAEAHARPSEASRPHSIQAAQQDIVCMSTSVGNMPMVTPAHNAQTIHAPNHSTSRIPDATAPFHTSRPFRAPLPASGTSATAQNPAGAFRMPGTARVAGIACSHNTASSSVLSRITLSLPSAPAVSSSSGAHAAAGACTAPITAVVVQRLVAIPNSFRSELSYQSTLLDALVEEVNLQIMHSVGIPFGGALARARQQLLQRQQPMMHRPSGLQQAQQSKNSMQLASGVWPMASTGLGSLAAGGPHAGGLCQDVQLTAPAIEAACQHSHVLYFSNAELTVYKPYNKGGAGSRRPAQGKKARDDGEGLPASKSSQQSETFHLVIPTLRARGKHFRKDDLWFIGSDPQLQRPQHGQDMLTQPWLALCCSLWHGPDKDGKFEVEFLAGVPPRLGRSQQVYALKGPDVGSDLQLLVALHQADVSALPLLRHLKSYNPFGVPFIKAANASGRAFAAVGSSSSLTAPDGRSYKRPRIGMVPTADMEGKSPEAAVHVPPDSPTLHSTASSLAAAEQTISDFGLNGDQASVVRHVASWLQLAGDPLPQAETSPTAASPAPAVVAPPVCLVHGPFGTGKSSLLVALITFLISQAPRMAAAAASMSAAGLTTGAPSAAAIATATAVTAAPLRVLVAAHTNVAVDRVLLGLQERGFTDFLRVGSLQRIAKPILPHSLHSGDDHKSAVQELKDMLREADDDPLTQAICKKELKELQAGADKKRRQRLGSVPVVGATCCALLQPIMDDARFTVVVLDECSQMTEPLSLVPLLRTHASFLIAAGDPLQLPPVIAAPSVVTPIPAHTTPPTSATSCQLQLWAGGPGQLQGAQQPELMQQQVHGLLRPMFVRLAQLGYPTHLLRTQYRCHPVLSATSNRCFYDSRLLDGVSPEQRSACLPGLPPLLFCSAGGEAQVDSRTRSSYNMAEAQLVGRIVTQILDQGLAPSEIGVICLYKAQVAVIQQVLGQRTAATAKAPPSLAGSRSGFSEGHACLEAAPSRHKGGVAVQVATIDSFQGAERDVVILATTLSRPSEFAADPARLNVALTRAKRHLLLLGCAPALQPTSPVFRDIIRQCEGTFMAYYAAGGVLLGVMRRAHAAAAEQEDALADALDEAAADKDGGVLHDAHEQHMSEFAEVSDSDELFDNRSGKRGRQGPPAEGCRGTAFRTGKEASDTARTPPRTGRAGRKGCTSRAAASTEKQQTDDLSWISNLGCADDEVDGGDSPGGQAPSNNSDDGCSVGDDVACDNAHRWDDYQEPDDLEPDVCEAPDLS